MIWWSLAGAGLVCLLLGFLSWANYRVAIRKTPQPVDDKELRQALLVWEQLVHERFGTIRDVKLFANRVRFVWSMIGEEIIREGLDERRKSRPRKECGGRVEDSGGARGFEIEARQEIVALCALAELGEVCHTKPYWSRLAFENTKRRLAMRAFALGRKHWNHNEASAVEQVLSSIRVNSLDSFSEVAAIVEFTNVRCERTVQIE